MRGSPASTAPLKKLISCESFYADLRWIRRDCTDESELSISPNLILRNLAEGAEYRVQVLRIARQSEIQGERSGRVYRRKDSRTGGGYAGYDSEGGQSTPSVELIGTQT